MLRTIAVATPDEEDLMALLAAAQRFDEEAASLEIVAKNAPAHG
ncbi:MAG TPA: hypothetical protein VKR31_15775 [Rhizomicrobium sp.]|nr:hypothetical protein [Rhizomicrobium sp.]